MNFKTISKPVTLFATVASTLLVFPAVALTVFDGSGVSENERKTLSAEILIRSIGNLWLAKS